MGELSKKIGEYGEEVVRELLEEIGWIEVQKGIELPNLFQEKYDKKTYGIDFFMSYECPITDNTIKNVLISVKYHKDKYPDNFKSLAKKHFVELSEMLHSFSYSEEKEAANINLNGNLVEDIGVLIWLCHKESNINLRKEFINIRLELPFEQTKIILLDNIQTDFLFTAIGYLKNSFSTAKCEFFYPNNGQNLNPLTKVSSGKILPIEFISSPLIPFKITDDKIIYLAMVTSEGFNKSNLRRIIGLALEISTDLSNRIILAFPDYDELENSNEFNSVKSEFSNKGFIDKMIIGNYNDTRLRIK